MKPGNFLKYFILAVVAANIAVMALALVPGLKSKPIVMPNPNGYDDFVKAGQMLPVKPNDSDLISLAKYVSSNESSFKLAEVGLSRDCRVPDNYSRTNLQQYWQEPMAMHGLASALAARGRLAKLEGRTNDSIETFLEVVSLGAKSARGGQIPAKLGGISCESIGENGLLLWATNANELQCRHISQALFAVDTEEEPIEEVLAQENKFFRETTTLREKWLTLKNFKTYVNIRNGFRVKYHNSQLKRRQMILSFAIRAYEINQGHSPTKITDLVPTYLNAIPQDPTTGTNLSLTARPNFGRLFFF